MAPTFSLFSPCSLKCALLRWSGDPTQKNDWFYFEFPIPDQIRQQEKSHDMTVNIFIRCAVQRNRINQSNWIIIVNGYTISRCTIFRTAMRKELKCCPSSLHILALSLLFSLALIYRSCYAHIWFFPTSVFPFIVLCRFISFLLIPFSAFFTFISVLLLFLLFFKYF